jgi:hypothetical protein
MTLDHAFPHPSHMAYVVKLNRDALAPPQGELSGRVEHLLSGEHADFACGDELLSWLAQHAQPVREPQP